MSSNYDWRKQGVKREGNHEALVDKLCSGKNGQKGIFRFIKDLMVFAAMVGYSQQERKPLNGDSISIILETYATDEKDAFIYLLALMTEKDGVCLKDDNLPSSVKIFEEYCNAGLYEIQLWLDENPSDIDGVDTLLDKINEKAIQNDESDTGHLDPEDLEVVF